MGSILPTTPLENCSVKRFGQTLGYNLLVFALLILPHNHQGQVSSSKFFTERSKIRRPFFVVWNLRLLYWHFYSILAFFGKRWNYHPLLNTPFSLGAHNHSIKPFYFSLFSFVVFLKYDLLTIYSLQVKILVILPLTEAAVIYACWMFVAILVLVQLVWGFYQMVQHARKV